MKTPELTTEERDILTGIAGLVSGATSLKEAMDAVFRGIGRIIPCERLDAGLLEENGLRMVLQCVRTAYEPVAAADGETVDIPGSFYQRPLDSGKPFISDPGEHGRDFEILELSNLLVKEGIRSHVVVPVVSGETVLGVLSCGIRRAGAYTERHGILLAEIAGLLQYQIEKALQADRIEKNYRAYMEMLSFVSHELKSPISSIVTLVQTMQEGYYGKMDEKQRDILDRILKKAEYLNAVSSQYLNLSRFESSVIDLQPRLVDFIDDVIEPVVDILLPQMAERKVAFERDYVSTVFPVRCDPDLMRIVIMNLVGNGIKYGNQEGVLRISLTKSFKKFSLSVWNEGPGFSEQEKHLLFKKFSRLRAAELIERKGSGIGLYVSWKIVQLHCGRLTADSEHGSWARFIMEMPQYLDLCIVE
jgi:signal transduction histidine kinase